MTTVGIDLGTTNSSIGVVDASGNVTVLKNALNEQVTPSAVTFLTGQYPLVGKPAAQQRITEAERTVLGSKRLMGRRIGDFEVEKTRERVAYDINEADGRLVLQVGEFDVTPGDVAAYILADLKATAETYLGEQITSAVVTVPAFFDDAARQATREAAMAAGLTDVRLLNEPTAAALAYGYRKQANRTIVVYDLGGGTLDVSVLRVADDNEFYVLAVSGDTFLGGDDIDTALTDLMLERARAKFGQDVSISKLTLQRLREEAEKAKKQLSGAPSFKVAFPFFSELRGVPIHLSDTITRDDLERVVTPLLDRLLAPCEDALERAGLKASEIDDVLLVGGMTRMPLIAKAVESFFGRKARRDLDPELVVTQGAALFAGVLQGDLEQPKLHDITPHSLGIETGDGGVWPILPAGSPLGSSNTQTCVTHEDNQTSVAIRVVQGEAERAGENRQLGVFSLKGLEPRPAGEVEIDVTFAIDPDGIVTASARDALTGLERHIEVAAL